MDNVLFEKYITASRIADIAEYDRERTQAAIILGSKTFHLIETIVENEPFEKRTAFYNTITKAAAAGVDFSCAETIKDIANIYAAYLVKRYLGSEEK